MQRTIIDLILLSSLVIAGPISNYQRQQEDRRWFAIDPNQPPVISGPVANVHSHVEDKRWFDLLDPTRRAPVAASDDTRSSEDRIWFHLWPQHGKRQASGTALAQPSQVSTTILPLPAQSSTPSQVQSGGGGKTVTINTQTTIGVTTTITIPANGGSVSSATSSSPTSAVASNGTLIPSSATGSINGAQTQPQTQARASSSVSIVFVTLSPTFTGPIAGYTTLTGNGNAAGVAASAPTGSSVAVSASSSSTAAVASSSSPDTSAVTSSGVTAQGSIPAALSSVFASFDASRSTSAVSTNSANATVSLAGSPQSPSAVSPFPPLNTVLTSTSVNAPVSTATVTATVTVAPSLNSASVVSNTQSTASSKSSTTQSSSTFASSSSTSTRASASSAKSPVSSTSSNSSSTPAASTSINQQGLTVIPITTSATTTVTGSSLAPRDAVHVHAAEPAPSGNTVQPFTSPEHDSPLSNSIQALARSTVTILETRTITPSTPAQSSAAAQGLAPEIIPTVQTGTSTVTVTATRVVFATPQ